MRRLLPALQAVQTGDAFQSMQEDLGRGEVILCVFDLK